MNTIKQIIQHYKVAGPEDEIIVEKIKELIAKEIIGEDDGLVIGELKDMTTLDHMKDYANEIRREQREELEEL